LRILDDIKNNDVSKLNLEEDPDEDNKSDFISHSEQYCSGIKEQIFNQNLFLQQKNKMLNKFI